MTKVHNKALVRTQTTLRFVCAAQLQRYVSVIYSDKLQNGSLQ